MFSPEREMQQLEGGPTNMESGPSTRLERLQAAQDRLLRYAHFRLGEELTKSRLGADTLPDAPSSPGVWDLAFAPDHADALGLVENSFDSFAADHHHAGADADADAAAADAASATTDARLAGGGGGGIFRRSTPASRVRSSLSVEASTTSEPSSGSVDVVVDAAAALTQPQTHPSQHHPLQDAATKTPGSTTAAAVTLVDNGSSVLLSDAAAATAGSSVVSVTGDGSGDGSSVVVQRSVRFDADDSGPAAGGSSVVSKIGPLSSSSTALSSKRDQHGHHQQSSALSKADSALAFLASRSQTIDPPVQALLNQVQRVGRKHNDEILRKTMRARPSHSYGTTKALDKSNRRQRMQRKRQRMAGTSRNSTTVSGMRASASAPVLPVFRSSTRLREIIDSRPVRRQPRRLAALAGSSSEQGSSSSSASAAPNAAVGNQTRRLNPHLAVPEKLKAREPTFLPVEWFDSAVLSENQAPPSQWEGLRAKSRWYAPDGTWDWCPCVILSYDPNACRFKVRFTARPPRLSRDVDGPAAAADATSVTVSETTTTTTSFFVTAGAVPEQEEEEGNEAGGGAAGGTTAAAAAAAAAASTVSGANPRDEDGNDIAPHVIPPTPRELPLSEVLPVKLVSRLNLWIPERETEAQLESRALAARRLRDAYESRARYLAHVQAMAPLVNLPPVSVPSELFQSALSRAGIRLDSPADLKGLSHTHVKALAKITEEVRRAYIDVMDVLHTQDLVTIPLPGMPAGAAGVPPPIRFESESLKTLRAGGIPLWSAACGCADFAGIRLPPALLLEDVRRAKEVAKAEVGGEEKKEGSKGADATTMATTATAATTARHTSSQGEEGLAPAGELTLLRKCSDGSPLSMLSTYLPHANPRVLEAIQSVGVGVVHRLQSMDWLWGPDSTAPPGFCFARSNLDPKALERAKRFPFPPLPARGETKDGRAVEDDPNLLPELPCSLAVFEASQMRQVRQAAKISHAHARKALDATFADFYGLAVDDFADELAAFEGQLAEARKKVSISEFTLPVCPDGIEPPLILRQMMARGNDFPYRRVKVGRFSERSSSQMASFAFKAPFRRALFLANSLVVDTVRDQCCAGLRNIVRLLEEYKLPVIPDDPAAQRAADKREVERLRKGGCVRADSGGSGGEDGDDGSESKATKIKVSSVLNLFRTRSSSTGNLLAGVKSGDGDGGGTISALARMLSLKRMASSISNKLDRQRRKKRKAARRERRRSVRTLARKRAIEARKASEDNLCRGGVPPLSMPRDMYATEVPYVERMLRAQGGVAGRSVEDLREISTFKVYEWMRPLFKVTLGVVRQASAGGATLSSSSSSPGGGSGQSRRSRRRKQSRKRSMRSKSESASASEYATKEPPMLAFDPPLRDFDRIVRQCMSGCVFGACQWECVNIDMLLPYDGSKERDHRGCFFATTQQPINTDDPEYKSYVARACKALRASSASVMALVLVLQRYKEFFAFDSAAFGRQIREEKAAKAGGSNSRPGSPLGLSGTGKGSRPKTGPGSFQEEIASDFERIDRCKAFVEEMQRVLVDELHVHAFAVDCRALKALMVGNAKMMVSLLLRDVTGSMRKICKAMENQFGEYHALISRWPKTVEEFDKQLHAVDLFDKTVGNLQFQLDSLGLCVDGLDAREYVPSDSDFRSVWRARGWPKRLTQARDKCLKAAKGHRERFEGELEHQKKMFSAEMCRLREEFREITHQGPEQWGESEEVANSVAMLETRLSDASEEADQIRKRCEVLGIIFDIAEKEGMGLTLSELRGQIVPFRELWESVSTWRRNQPEWIDGPFIVLDAEAVADYIRQCWRDMYRLVMVFDTDLLEEPVKVGNRLKKSVEEFKLYLPLITKLRNADLRPRHWSEVSKELGTRLRVDNTLTLRQLLASGAMESMTTIADISQTATLEVRFEHHLDQLEAAWDVTGRPGDRPVWEVEEEEERKRIERAEKLAKEEKERKRRKGSAGDGSRPTSPVLSMASGAAATSRHRPVVPICEAMIIKFQEVPRIKALVLSNPEVVTRVLEDHVLTTEKLRDSPYALPFSRRVAALRALQDKMRSLLFEWVDMQRLWLRLRPLFDTGTMKGRSASIYVDVDQKLRRMLDAWRTTNEGYDPSPTQIIETPHILRSVQAFHQSLQRCENMLRKQLEEKYWAQCPRTRFLSMEQCFRLNALEYAPGDIDGLVPLLFPGVSRLLLEPVPTERPETGETVSSSGSEFEDHFSGDEALEWEDSEEEADDEEEEDGEAVVSAQHFRNMMCEVHALRPSVLCGFGARGGHGSHHGANGFYFKTAVQLFRPLKRGEAVPNGSSPQPARPLVTWLNEAEAAMRVSLLEAVTHAYEALALFYASSLGDAAPTFYAWLFRQPAQVVSLAQHLLFTSEVESALRLAATNAESASAEGKHDGDGSPFRALQKLGESMQQQLGYVTAYICSNRLRTGRKAAVAFANQQQRASQSPELSESPKSQSEAKVLVDTSNNNNNNNAGDDTEQEVPVSVAVASQYVSLLAHHRDRVHVLHEAVRSVVGGGGTVTDASGNLPVDHFEWSASLRTYLRAKTGSAGGGKPDASTLTARSRHQLPHAVLAPTSASCVAFPPAPVSFDALTVPLSAGGSKSPSSHGDGGRSHASPKASRSSALSLNSKSAGQP